MDYAEYVGLVTVAFTGGWLLGALLTMGRVRAAERVLREVELELAIPSRIRFAVAAYFAGDR